MSCSVIVVSYAESKSNLVQSVKFLQFFAQFSRYRNFSKYFNRYLSCLLEHGNIFFFWCTESETNSLTCSAQLQVLQSCRKCLWFKNPSIFTQTQNVYWITLKTRKGSYARTENKTSCIIDGFIWKCFSNSSNFGHWNNSVAYETNALEVI